MYYTLEQAANVLKITPGELNRMREKGLLRAFKDGNTWKFRKEDIDTYLANQIKSRSDSSASLGAAESDLLSDTDDEAVTQTADTNSFESLVSNIPISARNDGGDKDVVLVDDNSGISGNDDDLSFEEAADSGISLLDEDEDVVHTSSDSGISLDDDILGGSNVDLGGMSDADDFILGGSGSGMNLGGDSGISLDDGPDQVNVAGASGISLMEDDDDIFTTADEEPTRIQGAPENLGKGASQEVEELRLADDQPEELTLSDLPQSNDDHQEEFQLATSPSDDESDSESSSQIIPLADDNAAAVMDDDPFVTVTDDETDAGGVYGLAGGETDPSPKPAADDAQPSEAAAGLDGTFGNDFAESGFTETDPSTGFGDGFGEGGLDDGGFGTGGFGAEEAGGGFGGLPSVETPVVDGAGDIGAEPVGDSFTQPAAAAPVVADAEYSTMSVWLGLIPCLLLLCLAGIGVYELIRTMWSWSQPFALTGTVLETVGNLLKLT
ncbi:MAG: helix-turn-helix domain-containing protein [Thermoguttaceae bacterium]|nr:helix-turn-helix domain-containing protein [Thermoguttaceae bacterium]